MEIALRTFFGLPRGALGPATLGGPSGLGVAAAFGFGGNLSFGVCGNLTFGFGGDLTFGFGGTFAFGFADIFLSGLVLNSSNEELQNPRLLLLINHVLAHINTITGE